MTAGRPKKEIDFNDLEKLCLIQCTAVECAAFFDTTITTLDQRLKEKGYDNFLDYIEQFSARGKASLRRMQWKSANEGKTAMLIWLGKQYLGQRDKTDAEISGKDGGAPVFAIEMTEGGKFRSVKPRLVNGS